MQFVVRETDRQIIRKPKQETAEIQGQIQRYTGQRAHSTHIGTLTDRKKEERDRQRNRYSTNKRSQRVITKYELTGKGSSPNLILLAFWPLEI